MWREIEIFWLVGVLAVRDVTVCVNTGMGLGEVAEMGTWAAQERTSRGPVKSSVSMFGWIA